MFHSQSKSRLKHTAHAHPRLVNWILGLSAVTAGVCAFLYRHYLPKTRMPRENFLYPYALVLGCPSRKDGSYSTSQKNRCNLAIEAWKRHDFETLVISGSAVRNEYVECEQMAKYIRERCDMPIILEDQARNTWDNLANTRKLTGDVPILIITGSLHARRASAMARNFFSDYGLLYYPDTKPKRILREIPSRMIYVRLELAKDLNRLKLMKNFLSSS